VVVVVVVHQSLGRLGFFTPTSLLSLRWRRSIGCDLLCRQ